MRQRVNQSSEHSPSASHRVRQRNRACSACASARHIVTCNAERSERASAPHLPVPTIVGANKVLRLNSIIVFLVMCD